MQIFISYIKRLLLSPLFYLAIVMVGVICWFGMQEENARPGVIYAFDLMLDISSYRKLMMLFATIPFGTVYCRERNTKMANFILYRSSLSKHLSVYLVMQFVSSFLIVFLGILLCIGLFCIRGTLYCYDGNDYTGTFGVLLNEKDVGLYLFFRTFHYAYSIAVWSLSGLAMSACFLNAYLAVCAPLVFSYVLEMITIESKFLPILWYLSLSYTDVSSNPWLASAYIILVFSCLGIVFAFVFWQIAKRRVQDVIH